MGRNQFVMDTKGYCIFCLTPARPQVREWDEEEEERQDVEEASSLHRICHYLKLNMRKIFHDVITVTPSSLPVLEKSELKGVLCEECSQQIEIISEITLELEVLQMTLDSCLKKLHDKVKDVQGNAERTVKFKQEMLNSPQSLLHYGIVDKLRNETLKKSSLLIENSQPRVLLTRLDIHEDTFALETGPQLSDSIPVISHIQGSYSGTNSRSAPKTKMKSALDNTELGPNAGDRIPRPGTPLITEMELGLMYEDPIDSLHSFEGTSTVSVDPVLSRTQPVPALPRPMFKESNLKCKFCPKSFSKRSLRRLHEKGHRKFQCVLCSKSFVSKSSLNMHQKQIHGLDGSGGAKPEVQSPLAANKRPPYAIKKSRGFATKSPSSGPPPARVTPVSGSSKSQNVCSTDATPKVKNASTPGHEANRRFQIGNIERIELTSGTDHDLLPEFLHEENDPGSQFHQEPEDETNLNKRFKCQHCDIKKEFSSLRGLRQHQTLTHFAHLTERKYTCEVCGKKYILKQHLKLHRRSVHLGKRYNCQFCSLKFTQLGSMKVHIRKSCPNLINN